MWAWEYIVLVKCTPLKHRINVKNNLYEYNYNSLCKLTIFISFYNLNYQIKGTRHPYLTINGIGGRAQLNSRLLWYQFAMHLAHATK